MSLPFVLPLYFAFSPRAPAAPWTDGPDAPPDEALKAQAEQRARALQAELPSLRRLPLPLSDMDFLTDERDSEETPLQAVLARADRLLLLGGEWAGGEMTLRLHDGLLAAELALAGETLAAARAELPALLERLSRGCGWPLVRPAGEPPRSFAESADDALRLRARGHDQARRRLQRERRLQAAGPLSAALLSVAAWALAGLLLQDALRAGTLAASVDRAHPVEFSAQRLEGAAPGFDLMPRHRLAGTVAPDGRFAVLDVPRGVYLRAAPGARYTVLRTTDAQRPIVLPADAPPPLLAGAGWGLSGTAPIALLPLALWGFAVLRPVLSQRTPAMWVRLSRRAIGVAAGAAVAAALWWVRAG